MDRESNQPFWIRQVQQSLATNERLQIIHIVQHQIWILYLEYAVDTALIYPYILQPLQQVFVKPLDTVEEIIAHVHTAVHSVTTDLNIMVDAVMQGQTLLVQELLNTALLFKTAGSDGRSATIPENESQIYGPQLAFVESLDLNLQTVVRLIPDRNLVTKNIQLGCYTKTDVTLLYMENFKQSENVEQLLLRLKELNVDSIYDSGMLVQLINDNTNSVLPQMILTERPDRVVSSLMEGKLVLLVNGSAQAIVTPCSFFDYFKSNEDFTINRSMSLFIRLLRLSSLFIALFITPIYVAVMTYHYYLVPQNMLVSLIESRTKVPFPPLFEVLFLELVVELLREAGTRLPTKVGQTMGIVGGIVIGQAAVQAGFTSNILIILVALTSLSNSIVPVYMMGTAIKLLRYPMIIMAGFLGLLGIVLSSSFILLHLLRLSSLNKPYLYPDVPLRTTEGEKRNSKFPLARLISRYPFEKVNKQTQTRKQHSQNTGDIYEEPFHEQREASNA